VDKTDAEGMTPLLYACKNGQMRLAKYLLKERQPSAKAKNAHGWTGLHFLASSAASSLHQGSRGKGSSNREKKAKERTNSQDRLEVAELLLANGCDVNAKAGGVSAFYVACMEGDRELVKLCIDHGAQVNTTGEAEDKTRVDEMQEGNGEEADDMNVEEWTDDDEGAWDATQSNAMDEDDDVRPSSIARHLHHHPDRTSPTSESHFKGKEDVAHSVGKRSRSKSYRERVNIFQRDREEEAIGESGTRLLHPFQREASRFHLCRWLPSSHLRVMTYGLTGEEEINLNKGPLLVNIVRRQNRKNFSSSGDMEKSYLEVIKILLDNGAGTSSARSCAHARTGQVLIVRDVWPFSC
jgi:hypothetical protein